MGNKLSTSKVSNMRVDADSMAAGMQAGNSFNLHRPMGANAAKLQIGN